MCGDERPKAVLQRGERTREREPDLFRRQITPGGARLAK